VTALRLTAHDPADHPRLVTLYVAAILAYEAEHDPAASAAAREPGIGTGPAHERLLSAAATIHLVRLRGTA